MISVITPVYNGESFIESCIKIVIEQNCGDVEHIIVEGGSKMGQLLLSNNMLKNILIFAGFLKLIKVNLML